MQLQQIVSYATVSVGMGHMGWAFQFDSVVSGNENISAPPEEEGLRRGKRATSCYHIVFSTAPRSKFKRKRFLPFLPVGCNSPLLVLDSDKLQVKKVLSTELSNICTWLF